MSQVLVTDRPQDDCRILAYDIRSEDSKLLAAVCMPEDDEKYEDLKSINDIRLKNKVTWLFPGVDERQVLFIAGRSGSGKSRFIRDWCMLYQKKSKRKVYIISSKDEDVSIDNDFESSWGTIGGKLKISQLLISEDNIDEFTEEKILSDFRESTVVFDDVIMANRALEKKIDKILEMMMALGRQNEINILVSRHQLQDIRNKRIKEEAHAVVVFPQMSFKKHIEDMCKQIGMSKTVIAKILNSPHRWVYIRMQAPLFAMNIKEMWSILD